MYVNGDKPERRGMWHFGGAVSAPPSRRWPFRRWDFSALGHFGTGHYGAGRFGAGAVWGGGGSGNVTQRY